MLATAAWSSWSSGVLVHSDCWRHFSCDAVHLRLHGQCLLHVCHAVHILRLPESGQCQLHVCQPLLKGLHHLHLGVSLVWCCLWPGPMGSSV